MANSPRLRRWRRVRWGNLRRLEPVSPRWGSGRGTAVDRGYIEHFFEEHRHLITGRVLEVRDARYSTQYGHDLTAIDIVDIDPRNDDATIIADLAERGSLPAGAFDCVVVPQTLVYVTDPVAAVANLWDSLSPGGALLLTTPAIARLDPDVPDLDRWHLMPAGLEQVIRQACPDAAATIRGYGNPVVAVAFLHGIAAEELRPADLAAQHPGFPVVVTAAVRKEAS